MSDPLDAESIKQEAANDTCLKVMSEPLDAESIKREAAYYTCLRNCFGVRHNAAGCCKISDRDYIIGRIGDAQDFLDRLNEKSEVKYQFKDVFIEYKEGSKLFPDKVAWQKPDNYPALRPKMTEPDLPCQFLTEKHECGVYDIRPQTCRKYQCEHLKKVLELF